MDGRTDFEIAQFRSGIFKKCKFLEIRAATSGIVVFYHETWRLATTPLRPKK